MLMFLLEETMMKKVIVVLCALLFMSGTSMALVVENYSFEDYTVTDFGGEPEPTPGDVLAVWNGFDVEDGAKSGWTEGVWPDDTWHPYPHADVPGWHNTGPMNDGGAMLGGTDGSKTGWMGMNQPEVWNLTSNLATAGESYILTIDAKDDWTNDGNATLRMTLYYDDGGRVDIGSVDLSLPADYTFHEYSNAFVAPAAADGMALGIALQVVTDTELASYVHFDNVRLVPEPATMLVLGLGGLLIRRRK
jgi:hypothetical protein